MGFPLKRTLARIFRIALIGVVLAYALQEYLYRRQYYVKSHNSIQLNDPPKDAQDIVHESDENATIWRLMVEDPTISQYVKLNEQFKDIRGRLDNANEMYTLYVPIDSAFENQTYPVDAPDFYWKFLSLNHMGPGAVSHEVLIASSTVKNFINHDIYFKYLQRLSVKDKDGDLIFNHVGKYVGKEIVKWIYTIFYYMFRTTSNTPHRRPLMVTYIISAPYFISQTPRRIFYETISTLARLGRV